MNRDIKFRVFDSRNKKMITNNVCFQLALSVDGIIKAGITGDVLMQYTGLKDKNGKEIYEGDIVVEKNSKRYVVKWEEDTSSSSNSSSCGFCWSKEEAKHIEVIGNIYENPEFGQSSE